MCVCVCVCVCVLTYVCSPDLKYLERYCPRFDFKKSGMNACPEAKERWTKWHDDTVWWSCLDEIIYEAAAVGGAAASSASAAGAAPNGKTALDRQKVVSKLLAMLKWEWILSVDYTVALQRGWYDMAAGRRPKQGIFIVSCSCRLCRRCFQKHC